MFVVKLMHSLTRAREWGSKLRGREGGQNLPPPPDNSVPMIARQIFVEGSLAKDSIVCNFCDRKLISSRSNNFEFQIFP